MKQDDTSQEKAVIEQQQQQQQQQVVNADKGTQQQNDDDSLSVEKTSGEASKTRRSGSKKKTKPASAATKLPLKEEAQQENANADSAKDKVKRKKSKKPKKKSTEGNSGADKENATADSITAENAGDSFNGTAENKTPVLDSSIHKSSKKQNGKKKAVTTEEKKQPAVNGETYTIDYKGLHDALKASFSLDDRQGPIYFAPTTHSSRAKTHHEKPFPKSSYSVSTTGSASRNSNTSSPSIKNRHAEIPPPPSLTVERLGKTNKKKKHAGESTTDEKSTIAKIKKTRSKTAKKKPHDTTTEATNDAKSADNHTENNSNNKKPKSDATDIGTPVKPIVFVKEEKKQAPVIKKPSKVTTGEKKRETREVKKGLKGTEQTDYCHPNDIIQSGRNSRLRFNRYLDPKICKEKIEQGLLYQGELRINKRSRTDAYVTCENLDGDIFINGQHDRNRALEGDTVVVELLDLEKVWAKKKASMIQKREQRHSTAAERPPQEEGEDDRGKPKYVGKVVAITATHKNQVCSGILSLQGYATTPQQDSNNSESEETPVDIKNVKMLWFKPTDLRKPLIAIPVKSAPADFLKNHEKYKNMLLVAKITRWPVDSRAPFGVIVRELGHIGNIVAETQAVLEDNGIVEQPFGKKALKGLPKTPWSISKEEIEKRRDLRDTRIFTIDPATAKDLDDAVHITKISEDEFEVGVHIADVSHFVHQHTALDHEAFDRGTSTYLCDRVIPMLPSLLCEQLCSLNPGVERLAFSVIWKMDGAGNIKDTWFGKSVIKSCAKLAYEDAQSVIEDKGLPSTAAVKVFSASEVEQDIKYLFKISKQMRERRFDNGALSINSIRLSFRLNELGEPCDVAIYQQKEANRLIEEFMLCANMSVAAKIASHYPDEALLRQHSPPHERTLNEFIKIAENLGYHFDSSSAGSMQKSFNAITDENAKAVLRLLAVKPMQRAKYFCTGSCDISKYRHYALNVPLYTHFTSPIRRFADIIVHRQLEAALNNKEHCGYKKDAVVTAASHCNERKEGAKNAQDMNIQLYLAHYLHMLETQAQKPVVCTAIVTQVLKDCFEILVPEYGLEKRIHMDALPINKFMYDNRKNSLAAYWKEGIDASREWDQNRKLDENYREPSGTLVNYGNSSDVENDDEVATKVTCKIPQELLSESLIDQETKMQRFESFSQLTVNISVNVERSPPIINVYPVNPFK